MFKTLVLMVHGGNSENRNDDEVEIREIQKNTYGINLGSPIFGEVLDRYLEPEKFEVLSPLFPNAVDANYAEWARFIDQILDLQSDSFKSIILIGHSLGTTTLQRYLSENNLSQKFGLEILQLHLVGCCTREGNFMISENWKAIENQVEQIYLYHSTDDTTCDFMEAQNYADNLTKAQFLKFTDRGHFEQENFPELITNINLIF